MERLMTRTVLLGGLFHETHTFLSKRTTIADFEAMAVSIGPDVVTKNLGNQSPTDGFLGYALERGWEVVPTIHMAAMPGGTVEDEVVELFRRHFFPALEEQLERLDGIFLILHGAMVSAGSDDPEGELLRDIRAVLIRRGVDIPVVGVLDLHANVSGAMIDNSTCLVAYRENPHNDARETAVRAARILGELMERPGLAQVHRPTEWILPPTGVGTADDPMKAVLAAARAIEARDPQIVNINVMAGYSYADVPDCGFSVSASTRGDPAIAARHLDELVGVLDRHIAKAYPRDAELSEVLAQIDALPPGKGPVLLVEPADNIGGGTPGDATDLLGPLLATGRKGIVAVIADAEAVAECAAAGLGAEVALTIGAKTDRHHGTPLPFAGRVGNLSDGRFELENKKSHLASMLGSRADMGPCAVVENEQARLLLTTRKMPPMDLGQLHSQGVRPEDASYVVVKAAVSHRDAYNPIMRASFNVDSAGLCTSNLKRLPYRKIGGKRVALP
jgi:microcystin degradation protein MlrC